mgnify:CR=1 FL=1
MNFKKNLAIVMAGAMVLTAAPVLPMASEMVSTAYAAKGGAKMSVPKAAPKAPSAAPKASTPSNSKSVSGNGDSYKPSKDAKSLDKNAPAANSKANTANTQSSSRWGSALRNIGLLAGGMFLGSMLSNMLGGLGGGMMADILGVIMNVVMLLAVIMLVKWLWNKFRGNKNGQNAYRSKMQASSAKPLDIKPLAGKPAGEKIQDIKGPDSGYNAKDMANRYRNR